jgi:hypothetical protein
MRERGKPRYRQDGYPWFHQRNFFHSCSPNVILFYCVELPAFLVFMVAWGDRRYFHILSVSALSLSLSPLGFMSVLVQLPLRIFCDMSAWHSPVPSAPWLRPSKASHPRQIISCAYLPRLCGSAAVGVREVSQGDV